MHAKRFNIGEIAKQADLRTDTIRYYEKQGLLPSPHRSPNGYRHYGPDVLHRLTFIRRAKNLGFSLREVGDLIELLEEPDSAVSGVKHRAQEKLGQIEARIDELHRQRQILKRLVSDCPGEGATERCPIIHALSE